MQKLLDKEERREWVITWTTGVAFLFYIMGILLFANVFWLVSLLKKKKDQVNLSIEWANFKKEKCNLWIILSTFSFTYLVRGFWDEVIWSRLAKGYWISVLSIFLNIIFDCIPIMLMLILHYKSFRKKRLTSNAIGSTATSKQSKSD